VASTTLTFDLIVQDGKATGTLRNVGREFDNVGKKAAASSQAMKSIGTTMAGAGLALAAGIGVAVMKFAAFDKQMSAVQAASGANVATMAKLRAAAIKAGADTSFSASEAAQAETELAKAGLSTSAIMGGALRGSLDLAAAGQIGLADAANLSGQAMKIFNLTGKDVPHIADVMTAGANKSAASVQDLSEALKQSGLVAAQTGLGLEDTVGVLSAFADNALIGSDAGTSFKTMLQRLNPTSVAASNAMKSLGINAYDSQGKFIGITAVAGELHASLGELSAAQRNAALATIFGSDAIRAATVLYNLGADGTKKYIDQVNDTGIASRTAGTLLDNLSGDLEKLRGSIETALIQEGSAGNGALRGLAQGATGAVNAFTSMPAPLQKATFMLGGAAAVALTLGGGILYTIGKVADFRKNLETLNISGSKVKGTLAGIGKAAGLAAGALAAAAAINALVTAGDAATASLEKTTSALLDLRDQKTLASLDELFKKTSNYGEDNVKGFTDALKRLTDPDLNSQLNKLSETISFGAVQSGQGKLEDQFKRTGEALAAMVQSGNAAQAATIFHELQQKAAGVGVSVDKLNSLMPAYSDALAGVSNEQRTTASTAGAASDGMVATAEAANRAEKAQKALKDSLDATNNAFLKGQNTDSDYFASLDDVTAALKENGRAVTKNRDAFNLRTAAGRADAQALRGEASALLDYVGELVDAQGVPMKGFQQRLAGTRAQLIEDAEKLGLSKTAARRYADQILAVPTKLATQVAAPGLAAARAQMQGLKRDILHINGKTVTLTINAAGGFTSRVVDAYGRQLSLARGQASGGRIPGPPSSRDNVLWPMARGGRLQPLAGGEYIVNAASTSRNLPLLEAINRGMAMGGYLDVRSRVSGPPAGSYARFGNAAALAAVNKLTAAAVKGFMGSSGAGMGGSGVQRWAPLVLRALAMMGQPASLLGVTLRRMNQESGGNPRAINNWDINARRGDPSRGLMQTIMSTFRAYHYPGTSWNIYDPLANILASMRYALARYGSLQAAYGKAGGYAKGGVFKARPGGTLARLGEGRYDEAVIPLSRARGQWSGVGGSNVTVIVQAPNYVGDTDDLVKALDRAARGGRLDRIVKLASA
jgi:TP901 family phage tail tape measure protein